MRRLRYIPSTALAGFLVIAGCGILDPDNDARSSLDEARRRWAARAIVDYEYRFRRSCECLPAATRTYVIRVVDEAIMEVRDAETGAAAPASFQAMTVPELFDVIGDALDRGADVITVEYDSRLGYPTLISVDYETQIADDEFVIHADALQPLP